MESMSLIISSLSNVMTYLHHLLEYVLCFVGKKLHGDPFHPEYQDLKLQ